MSMLGWYQFKLFIEHASGVSMDALHILVGFVLFLLAARMLRRPLRSFLPWAVLLAIELANEAYDLGVEVWPDRASQLGEGAKDILLTMALPTLVLAVTRLHPEWFIGSYSKQMGHLESADDDVSGGP